MRARRLIAATVAVALAGCATSSKNIAPSYTSPNQYAVYDCPALAAEGARIQTRVVALGGRLDEAANNDAGIMVVGLFIFWPVLFALGGTKAQEADYARLKGEYDAVEQAAIAKKCAHAMGITTAAAAPGAVTAAAPAVQPTGIQPAVYVAPIATAPRAVPVSAVAGESKYMFSAEQYVKARGCVAPMATMVVRQSLNETFSIDCQGTETVMVRCEAGVCRDLK